MSQLKQAKVQLNPSDINKLATQLIQQSATVESSLDGFFPKMFNIISMRSKQISKSVFGQYGYQPKNEFGDNQKKKILQYLQAKVFTTKNQLEQQQRARFIDYDRDILKKLPQNINQLRDKILRAKTNIQCAQQSLTRLRSSQKIVAARYLNEQAYEYDKVVYNSVCWGLVFGALFNSFIYRNGSTIRRMALFLACGHLFGAVSNQSNLNRYFDYVYPIFQKQAVAFSTAEQISVSQIKYDKVGVLDE